MDLLLCYINQSLDWITESKEMYLLNVDQLLSSLRDGFLQNAEHKFVLGVFWQGRMVSRNMYCLFVFIFSFVALMQTPQMFWLFRKLLISFVCFLFSYNHFVLAMLLYFLFQLLSFLQKKARVLDCLLRTLFTLIFPKNCLSVFGPPFPLLFFLIKSSCTAITLLRDFIL